MQFSSTRNPSDKVSFAHAILDCTPLDGGMYTPAFEEDLRPWIFYMDQNTSFSSIAGSLTSALLKDEFSPLYSETIATKAFNFSPELKQLDENLYMLELFHGPTGSHKDFGVSYLTSFLETVLMMQDKNAVILTPTNGETGSSIVASLRNKKHVKAVLLYAKGTVRGFKEEDCIWNGGNILPIEIDGDENTCFNIARKIFLDRQIISRFNLTLANTANIGRLLPQTFFYTYAFTRLKDKTNGDIFYALDAGNYGNLTAGLYSWKFCLPVNGFITDSTPLLHLDAQNNCCVQDSIIPLCKRGISDPIMPSNIERLEEVFTTNSAVIKGFVFPADVSLQDRQNSVNEAFMKYNVLIDSKTAGALSAMKKRSDITNGTDETTVLIARDHPAFDCDFIKHCTGESLSLPDNLKEFTLPVEAKIKCEATTESVIALLARYLA